MEKINLAIIGYAGTGKSNTYMNYIIKTDYDEIYLYTPHVNETLNKLTDKIIIDDINNIPELDSFNMKKRKLIIFDEFCDCDRSIINKILNYAICSRTKNFHCIFTSFNLYNLPYNIRQQCNYILYTDKINKKDLRLLKFQYDEKLINNINELCIVNGSGIIN